MPQTIYLDHAATTPLDPRVFETMEPYLKEQYGNASSVHAPGRKARFAVEDARERVAAHIGAEPSEIIFTSGATEADNTALRGVLHTPGDGLITSEAEHEAILEPARALEREGYDVTILKPESTGSVTADQIHKAVRSSTRLVSIMHANNETGTLNPISEIASVCRQHDILLHTDAVQSVGLLHPHVDALDVDLMSISAHKFYGPKGVGVLYVRGGALELHPIIRGGSQERKRRGGTENVAGIVGLAAALDLAVSEAEERNALLRSLQMRLLDNIRAADMGPYLINTPVHESDYASAMPHILNVSFPPIDGQAVDGEMLLLNLDMAGIYVSSGSACTSGAIEPSHVLLAMGRDEATAAATVRFSFGIHNTLDEMDYVADQLTRILTRMRGVYA